MTLHGTEHVVVLRGAHAGRHGMVLFVAGRRPRLEVALGVGPGMAYVALFDDPGIAVAIAVDDLALDEPS